MVNIYEIKEVEYPESLTTKTLTKEDIRKKYSISAGLLMKECGLKARYLIVESRKFQKELYLTDEVVKSIDEFVKLNGGVNVEHALFLRNRKQTKEYITRQKIKKC